MRRPKQILLALGLGVVIAGGGVGLAEAGSSSSAASSAVSKTVAAPAGTATVNVTSATVGGRSEQAFADLQQPAAPGWRRVGSALVEHSLGHAQQSQQALDQIIHDSAQFAAYQIAEIYAWRGEKDQAFQWLDRAYAQRDGGLTEVKNDPLLASLRADPRYKSFLAKMKLPQ